jgi:dihydropyrimidinase
MLDLLISGGQVVTPAGVVIGDIGIRAGRIVLVASSGSAPEAMRVVSAAGRLVVPGGIEPHTHLAHRIVQQPGEELYSLGPELDTIGLAFGGVTTHIDFCYVRPGDDPVQAMEERVARWRGQSFVDFSFHVGLTGEHPPEAFDRIPELVESGFPSFKVFTSTVLPPTPGRPGLAGFGRIAEIMRRAAASSGIVSVHAEDDEIVQYNYARFRAEGRTEARNMHLVHSTLSEGLAFRRTIEVAKSTGAAVHFVHTSSAEGVAAVAEARSRAQPVYAETLHGYLCHTADEYANLNGLVHHTYPSLQLEADRQALWTALYDGTLSTTATDELPTSRELKLRGHTISDVTGGNLGAEARLGIVYTEGVSKRGMSLERFVDVTSTNAARIFGLYPRKGVLEIGADADVTVLNTSLRKTLTRDDFHVADYSPWEGWEVDAWPETTILRGKVIVQNGRLESTGDYGELVPRRIAESVLVRPVC